MLRTCAAGAVDATEPRDGDVFFQWEPLNHVGGLQILVVALPRRITIAMVERFSASAFRAQVRACGATHIHYLGVARARGAVRAGCRGRLAEAARNWTSLSGHGGSR
jgi:hypothetical protein